VNDDLNKRLGDVYRRIERAATRTGRELSAIKLIAVGKTHPAAVLREAVDLGLKVFGENKVQEAESKIREIGRGGLEWHLIGHLQSNKARKAVQLFDVIQTLDSVELAERLERICIEEERELSVFVQVDLAGEESKAGVRESDLPKMVSYLTTCKHLRFNGLMLLPPFCADQELTRPYFKRLKEIRDDLASKGAFGDGNGELSMGMSHDFEVAIEEGATVIRVGTAIFGERDYGLELNVKSGRFYT